MDILVFVAGVLVGMGGMWLLRRKNKTGDSKGNRMPAGLEITLNDIIHLASLNSISDLNALMIEYRIPVKYPVFYEKYQMLSKQEKDFYFTIQTPGNVIPIIRIEIQSNKAMQRQRISFTSSSAGQAPH